MPVEERPEAVLGEGAVTRFPGSQGGCVRRGLPWVGLCNAPVAFLRMYTLVRDTCELCTCFKQQALIAPTIP